MQCGGEKGIDKELEKVEHEADDNGAPGVKLEVGQYGYADGQGRVFWEATKSRALRSGAGRRRPFPVC